MPSYSTRSSRYRDQSHNYHDPSRPDYRPLWWAESADHWLETLDWVGNLKNFDFKNYYLLDVPGEFKEDRVARIKATNPEPFFKDSVKDNTSIFTQFELAEDAPVTLFEYQNNVDLRGTGINQWASGPLKGFFRDGGALMGVQPPMDDDINRRPSLTWVPMRDVYWPEYSVINGAIKLSRISIKRATTKRSTIDGTLIQLNNYWVYELDELGNCSVVVWAEDEKDNINPNSDPVSVVGANGSPMGRLPFTDKLSWLGSFELTEEEQLYSPLSDLLALNQEHFNAYSEYTTVKRKTALPTPNRFWANGVPDNPPPFYAGTGRCGDYDAGSRVEYLELTGVSLPELRQSILDIETKIAKRDNKLFSQTGGRSATEAEIENTKAKVGLPGIKVIVESAFQDLFQIWEAMANPSPEQVGGIKISEQALKQSPDPNSVMARVATVDRTGVPVNAAVSAWVREGYYKPEDFESTLISANGNIPVDPNEVIE